MDIADELGRDSVGIDINNYKLKFRGGG